MKPEDNRFPAFKDDGQDVYGTRVSLFLNNFEQWIQELVSREGLADGELIRTIREKFERSMQANITHHKFMMNSARENGDQVGAERHRLMAEVYRELLPAESKAT